MHVAKLAGVPKAVTTRANEVLRSIERKNVLNEKKLEKENKKETEVKLEDPSGVDEESIMYFWTNSTEPPEKACG